MVETVGSRPVPDPTELTDKAIARAMSAQKDYIDGQLGIRDERLAGIDEATRLRLVSVDHIPDQIALQVHFSREFAAAELAADRRFSAAETAHLREIDDTRFAAAEKLAARESELNALALAAAFAAQKEASAKEAEYTRIASVKAESATAQAIDKLGELFATQTHGLGDKVDDLKDRTGRIESGSAGKREQSGDQRMWILAGFAGIAAIAAVIFGILAAFHV